RAALLSLFTTIVANNFMFSDHGSMIVPQVAAAARDAGQPPETLASPPAIDRTTNLSIGRNVNVTGTNARTTTEASDTVMVDIGNLSIRQDNQLIMSVLLKISFQLALEEELPQLTRNLNLLALADCRMFQIRFLQPITLAGLAVTLTGLGHHSELVLQRPPILIAALDRPTRASSTARVRAQAANLRRSLPEFARSNMSRPDSSPSPPSSPVPPIPATPRMRPARPPIMDGRTSAALTVTMFFRCLRSIRLTLRTFPANHLYAAQHQQLRNKTDLMELWFHNHHEHLQEELNNPQSPARLVYHTLFSCAGHLIQLTNLPPTYNPLDPTM
ncbi:hypothetical protein PSHT_14495, partial [Puccinia striiformis]